MFKLTRLLMAAAIFLTVAMSAYAAAAQTDVALTCPLVAGEAEELDEAKLYAEYNFTDGDLGVHGIMDSDGWSVLCLFDPDGTLILGIAPQAQLGEQNLAELFFESAEPTLDDFSFDDLRTHFPEGEYQAWALTADGAVATSTALFTHNVPAAPVIVAPEVGDEDEAEDLIAATDNLVVAWEPVTETVDGEPVTITGYEVIITREDFEDPNGLSQPIFDVNVPADRTSLTISPEFFEPGELYELEILALEESGNQTISLGFFTAE